MRLLKISTPDFVTRNLRRDREHRHAVAMTIVKAIDKMEIAGAAAPCADSQLSREMSFGAGRKCSCLLVPDRHPGNVVACPNGIGDSIQRIARYSQNPLDTRRNQRINKDVGDSFFRHNCTLSDFLFVSQAFLTGTSKIFRVLLRIVGRVKTKKENDQNENNRDGVHAWRQKMTRVT